MGVGEIGKTMFNDHKESFHGGVSEVGRVFFCWGRLVIKGRAFFFVWREGGRGEREKRGGEKTNQSILGS